VTSRLHLATALSVAAFHALSCASANDKPKGGASSSAESVATWAPPATAEEAKASVLGADATTLERLGGAYLCNQNIYPQSGGPHISAWEWAFPTDGDELATKLARELPFAQREGLDFSFPGAEGKPSAVISVRPLATNKSALSCQDPPAGTKSYVLASHM